MNRKYVTGWFSPADPEMVVLFYRVQQSSSEDFEADVVKSGGVVQTFRDTSLGRLQMEVTDRCGGRTGGECDRCVEADSQSSWLARIRPSRLVSRTDPRGS